MSNYDAVKEAIERALSLANDAYDAADSAESSASEASGYANQASDAAGTALEELAAFQPFDSDDLERLVEIQFALLDIVGVNARRMNRLIDGNKLSYTEANYLRSLHHLLLKLTTRGDEDLLVYAERVTEFNIVYGDLPSAYGKTIQLHVDKQDKEATNV
jgi:hypothetical protein